MHKVLKSVLQCFEEAHSLWLRLPKSPAYLLPLGSSVSTCQSVPSWGEGHIHFIKSAFKQEPVSLNSTSLSWPFRTNTLLQSGRQLVVTHREPAALSVQTLKMALSSQTFRTREPDLWSSISVQRPQTSPSLAQWVAPSCLRLDFNQYSRFSYPVTSLCLRCSSNSKHLYFHFCPCCLLFSCSLMYPWVMSSFTQALWSWKTETTC